MVLTRTDLDEIKRIVSDEVRATITKQMASLAENITQKLELKFGNMIKEVKEQSTALAKKVKELQDENSRLITTLDSQEQYSRRRNIRIFGLEIKQGTDIQLEVYNMLRTTLKIDDLQVSDIDRCYHVQSKVPDPSKPPAILVQFSDINKRSSVLKNRKNLKQPGITIKEDLTKMRLKLLHSAVNKFSAKSAWCLHGTVYVKSGNGDIHRVDNLNHLNQIAV